MVVFGLVCKGLRRRMDWQGWRYSIPRGLAWYSWSILSITFPLQHLLRFRGQQWGMNLLHPLKEHGTCHSCGLCRQNASIWYLGGAPLNNNTTITLTLSKSTIISNAFCTNSGIYDKQLSCSVAVVIILLKK